MRFLGVGDTADLAALYLRLVADGHDVKVFIGHSLCQDTLAGLIDTGDGLGEPNWVGFELLEPMDAFCLRMSALGAVDFEDHLRRDGFNVIGSSAYGARLENDRAYAQRTLRTLAFPPRIPSSSPT